MQTFEAKQEIDILNNIRIADQHKKIVAQWLAILEVLNSISQQLPIANDGFFSVPSTLKIEKKFLEELNKETWKLIAGVLYRSNLVMYKGYTSEVVTSSKPIRELLEGENIAVNDRISFEQLRRSVQEICDFGIQDGILRFNTNYKKFNEKSQTSNEFPVNLKWENIIIKFVNGTDVEIRLKNGSRFHRKSDCKEMGLEDKKSHKPKKAWKFFQILAAVNGSLSWKDNIKVSLKERENFQKRKEELAKVLIAYFGIGEDPFETYHKKDGYKIKVQLTPEVATIKKESSKDPYADLKEMMDEQQPSVLDKFNKF